MKKKEKWYLEREKDSVEVHISRKGLEAFLKKQEAGIYGKPAKLSACEKVSQ